MRWLDSIKEATEMSLQALSGQCGHRYSQGHLASKTTQLPLVTHKGSISGFPESVTVILSPSPLGVTLVYTNQRVSSTGAKEKESQAHGPVGS